MWFVGKAIDIPVLMTIHFPIQGNHTTYYQLEFTFDGQNHGFSKYVIFNTFYWRNSWDGLRLSYRYGILQKNSVSVTRFQISGCLDLVIFFFSFVYYIFVWILLTHKEHPDFNGSKSKIAKNCPKVIFAFDRKFQNSKTKLKNDPLN